MTHADLLAKYAASRDAEAFAGIVEQYQRLVFATCRRKLANPDDVDDAVQETFLRLARKASSLKSNLGGWLYACAVNVSTDINRRRQTRTRHEGAAAMREESTENPQRELAELREHLDAAMQKLSASNRELIIQRFFEGTPQAQIAAEAGVAASTISHRMDQAISALRENLKALGCTAAVVGGAAALMQAEHASAQIPAALTANVMKIGLSGVAAAASGWAAMVAISLVLLALIGAAVGIWFISSSPVAAPVAQSPPTSMPTAVAMTIQSDQTIATPPDWQAKQADNSRAVLAGRVTDAQGNGVAGATVTLFPNWEGSTGPSANTDGNGNYAINIVRESGEYSVGVKADGFVEMQPRMRTAPLVSLSPTSRARRNFVLDRGLTVTLKVVDETGKPIPIAQLDFTAVNELYSRYAGIGEMNTDKQGVASVVLPVSNSPCQIEAWADGRAPAHAVFTPTSAGKRELDIVLNPSLIVHGIAICTDGKPAAGWKIAAREAWRRSGYWPEGGEIARDGSFTLDQVGPGDTTLWIMVNNQMMDVGHVTFPTTQPLHVSVPLASPGSWVKVTGQFQYIGGKPDYFVLEAWKQGFNRLLLSQNVSPRASGGDEFTMLLPPGSFRFEIAGPGIEMDPINDVTIPGKLPTLVVRRLGKPKLSGTVTDAATGQPIQHFAMRLRKVNPLGSGPNYVQDENWIQVSDAQGRFATDPMGPGVYMVQISADGYAWQWSSKITAASGKINVPIALTPGGSLTGVVVDPSGKTIAGAKVIPLSMARSAYQFDDFESEAGAVMTDDQGRFKIDHLSPGSETLKLVRSDFAPTIARDLNVSEGKSSDAGKITLFVGGTIEGTVFDAHGKPAAGEKMMLRDDFNVADLPYLSAGVIAKVITEADGHYRIQHLANLPTYVTLPERWSDGGVVRRLVKPIEGITTELNLGGPNAITGRALLDGKPLANTQVQLAVFQRIFGPVVALATTDSDGRFTFFGPPPGQYTFFRHVERDDVPIRLLQIPAGPVDLGDVTNDPNVKNPYAPFTPPKDKQRVSFAVWNSDGTLATGVQPKLFDAQGKEVPLGLFGGEESTFYVTPGRYSVHVQQAGQPDIAQQIDISPGEKRLDHPIDLVVKQ